MSLILSLLTALATLALGCVIVGVGLLIGRGLVCAWCTLLDVRHSWRQGAR